MKISWSNQSFERWELKWSLRSFVLRSSQRLGGWKVDIRLTNVAVPLGDLVFEDRMVAKGIPRQLGYSR